MIRVKIIKPNPNYQIGTTVELSRNEAFGLLDGGVAVLAKDMVATDYKIRKKRKQMATLVSYALTTVADVKESLGITDSSQDNLVIRKINFATEAIEGWCRLPRDHHFKETTYTNEEYDGSGSNMLRLKMRPVSTLSSLQFRTTSENLDSWDSVDTQNYFLDINSGVVDLLYSEGTRFNSFRATYTAGFATIPADLAEAAVMLAAYLVENSTTGTNVKRQREGQREIEYFQINAGDGNGSLVEQLSLDDVLQRYVNYVTV